VDVSVLKLLDGTKAYIHAVIDNYSRKILAWMVAPRLEPTGTCQLLFAASKHIVCAGQPVVYVWIVILSAIFLHLKKCPI
jgi:transposase InsO family protein